VGAIWGIEVWSTIKNPKTLKLFLTTTRKIFEVRGGTHDTHPQWPNERHRDSEKSTRFWRCTLRIG